MNTPNKLTLLRFVLSAIFFAVALIEFPHHYLVALAIFIFASITDLIDGQIARKRNLITNFGKFLDPIADKMLTTAAFIAFTFNHIGFGIEWVLFIVLAREFVVTSVRLIASDNGKVIAANMWGKVKTVMQMVAIIATMFFVYLIDTFNLPEMIDIILTYSYSVLLWISGILTLIAGVTYLVDNRQFINPNK